MNVKEKILPAFLRRIGWRIVLGWCASLRITFFNSEKFNDLRKKNERFVVAFWHGSMLLGWFLHKPRKNERISALVSQSKDGVYLSTVLEKWNYTLIRGSSHIGGKEAMQVMTETVTEGMSIAITPDGPTGPMHRMKMGAVRLAQKTHVPLVLCGIAMKRKKHIRSWDKFEIPMPFSKAAVAYSDPIFISEELQGEPLNALLAEFENQMNALTRTAESLL